VAYIAVLQLGAVAMPLSMLFGPDALEYRLQDSGAGVAIVDETSIRQPAGSCVPPARSCASVLAVGGAAGRGDLDWTAALAGRHAGFKPVETAADDAAILIYTSGTTGPPKGALIPHRALIGNLTGFVCSQNWFGADGDEVFWSPADWAWTGGLMDALLPTLYFGREIVAFQGRFRRAGLRADAAAWRDAQLPVPDGAQGHDEGRARPARAYTLKLRAVMSAGEAVGDAVFAYCRDALGVTSTRCSARPRSTTSSATAAERRPRRGDARPGWPARPGSMGRPYPGHRIAVIDDAGQECPRGTPGDVAVHRLDVHGQPDPVFFLGYWHNDGATRRQVHRRPGRQLVPHRRHCGAWTTTATSGTRAAATTSSRPRATASARARSRTAWSSTRRWPTPRWCPSRTPSAVQWSRPMWCWRRARSEVRRWWRRTAGPCARAARALRVPEGDRVHRRAADDHHRQGAAAPAAAARGRARSACRPAGLAHGLAVRQRGNGQEGQAEQAHAAAGVVAGPWPRAVRASGRARCCCAGR
jgi:acyl-CoA synthetase (AMP-forming)/AMP-acid ligase II